MRSIIRYTLITAFRDFLFLGLFLLIILAIIVSNFLGNTAVSEQDQMALTYMAASLRMVAIVGLIVFVCFHVKRLFDNKEIEVILSRSISRTDFILSYWFAFTMLSVLLTIPTILVVAIMGKPHLAGLLFWAGSLVMEGAIVVAFAFLASIIMRSAVAATLSCFCFYFLSRMMGFFLASYKDYIGLIPTSSNFWEWFNQMILQGVSIIVPRLDMFAKTSWLVYGVEKQYDIWIYPVQSGVFIPLMLLVAIFDFKRKQF